MNCKNCGKKIEKEIFRAFNGKGRFENCCSVKCATELEDKSHDAYLEELKGNHKFVKEYLLLKEKGLDFNALKNKLQEFDTENYSFSVNTDKEIELFCKLDNRFKFEEYKNACEEIKSILYK